MAATVGDPRDAGTTSVYLAYYTSVYPYAPGGGPSVTATAASAPAVTNPRDSTAGVT